MLCILLMAGGAFRYRDSLCYKVAPEPAGSLAKGVVYWDRWRAQSGHYMIINEYEPT